jgi:chromosome segregation ATPase
MGATGVPFGGPILAATARDAAEVAGLWQALQQSRTEAARFAELSRRATARADEKERLAAATLANEGILRAQVLALSTRATTNGSPPFQQSGSQSQRGGPATLTPRPLAGPAGIIGPDLAAALAATQRDLQACMMQAASQRERIAQQDQQLALQHQQLGQQAQALSGMTANLSASRDASSAMQQSIASARTQAATLQQQVAKQEEQIASLRQQVSSNQRVPEQAISELRQKLTQQSDQLEEQGQRLAERDQALRGMASNLAAAQAAAAAGQQALENERAEMRANLGRVTAANAARIANEEKSLAQRAKATEETQMAQRMLVTNLQEAKSRLGFAEGELARTRKEIADVRVDRAQVQTLSTMLAEEKAGRVSSLAERDRARKQMADLRAQDAIRLGILTDENARLQKLCQDDLRGRDAAKKTCDSATARAAEAERRAGDAEKRANSLAIALTDSENNVNRCRALAAEATARATEATTRATEAEARARSVGIATEARLKTAREETAAAERRVQEATARATEASVRATEADARSKSLGAATGACLDAAREETAAAERRIQQASAQISALQGQLAAQSPILQQLRTNAGAAEERAQAAIAAATTARREQQATLAERDRSLKTAQILARENGLLDVRCRQEGEQARVALLACQGEKTRADAEQARAALVRGTVATLQQTVDALNQRLGAANAAAQQVEEKYAALVAQQRVQTDQMRAGADRLRHEEQRRLAAETAAGKCLEEYANLQGAMDNCAKEATARDAVMGQALVRSMEEAKRKCDQDMANAMIRSREAEVNRIAATARLEARIVELSARNVEREQVATSAAIAVAVESEKRKTQEITDRLQTAVKQQRDLNERVQQLEQEAEIDRKKLEQERSAATFARQEGSLSQAGQDLQEILAKQREGAAQREQVAARELAHALREVALLAAESDKHSAREAQLTEEVRKTRTDFMTCEHHLATVTNQLLDEHAKVDNLSKVVATLRENKTTKVAAEDDDSHAVYLTAMTKARADITKAKNETADAKAQLEQLRQANEATNAALREENTGLAQGLAELQSRLARLESANPSSQLQGATDVADVADVEDVVVSGGVAAAGAATTTTEPPLAHHRIGGFVSTSNHHCAARRSRPLEAHLRSPQPHRSTRHAVFTDLSPPSAFGHANPRHHPHASRTIVAFR